MTGLSSDADLRARIAELEAESKRLTNEYIESVFNLTMRIEAERDCARRLSARWKALAKGLSQSVSLASERYHEGRCPIVIGPTGIVDVPCKRRELEAEVARLREAAGGAREMLDLLAHDSGDLLSAGTMVVLAETVADIDAALVAAVPKEDS